MAVEDLNLEFEEEAEKGAQTPDAVGIDGDLEFGGPSVPVKGGPPEEASHKPPTSHDKSPSGPNKPQIKPVSVAPTKAPSPAQNSNLESSEAEPKHSVENVVDITELEKVKFDADVKIAVAEFKTEYLSELLSDIKVFQIQMNQLLLKLYQKNPKTKNEILALKKLLADFATKKRK